ncbi:Peptidase S41 [Flavobacterium sp. 9AF]|uniref:S41 family peptidase n=1 Tax=Flavobacterium sp. 9AF TaxID=2653142 RepID=UPI0012EF7CEE|nr:S41 family peptidase [Flavobacterium sp. 9AF]VXB73338.1 Peptidase S41 [Flavobacterium sp. 9AF]
MRITTLYFLFFFHFIFSQSKQENCVTITKINLLIQDYHYQPKPVDDSLSLYVFNTIIEKLDRERNIFLLSEYKNLSKHKYNIDNYILNQNCSFLDEFTVFYKKGLERKLKIIDQLEKENISLNTNDTLFFTKGENSFYNDEKGIRRILKKMIVYESLRNIALLSTNSDSLKLHFNKLAIQEKTKTFGIFKCKIQSLLKDEKNFHEEIKRVFFKAFCNYFDPHTDYYSYDDRSNFLSSLNSSNSSLGLLFEANENDEIFVNEIIPGSIAFENEKIETGDQVIKINFKNEEYLVNCSTFEQISNLISSDNYKELEFTFRKRNGEIYTALIEKKIMKAIENTAYSYVLNIDNKFGYIKIPSFYSSDFSINTLSNDVAKEIIKLKNDKIKGLIIDLQFNGGGNVDEAIKLAGMFIDVGPITIAVDNKKNKTILKDYNRGVIFNEPIVVLINGFSASASELFANTLQDYNRALVVGKTSYGKASMQSIVPLDDTDSNTDFINLTIQKFYRVTGKSHQATGTIPDIEIPYLFEKIVPKEKQFKTVLTNDEIVSNSRYKSYENDFSTVIRSSRERIKENPYFKKIINLNNEIDNLVTNKKEKIVLLDFNGVLNDVHETSNLFNKANELIKEKFNFTVENNSYDNENNFKTTFSDKISKKQIEEIQTSAIINEALQILNNITK